MLEKLPQKRMKRTTICIPGGSNGDQETSSGRHKLNLQITQTASPPSHYPDFAEANNLNHEALLAYYNTTG
jgi:hypothetical protein